MSLLRRWLIPILAIVTIASPAMAAIRHRKPVAHRYHHRYYRRRIVHHYVRSGMSADRVRQIQAALIQKHYLTGDPNGLWDAKTQAAMRSYQADHGWQTKLMPDARALIALGLGPKTDESHIQSAKNAAKQPQPSIKYADTLAAVQIIK